MTRKVLLVCGILSALLYVGTDMAAAWLWEGYSFASQTISELMAVGAPTRPLLVALFSVYNPLVIALGLGVWLSAGSKRSPRITGILLAAYGVVGQAGLLFAPMHLRGSRASATDTWHIILTGLLSLLILSSIGFGAFARGKAFRYYSLATILTLVIFGALAGMQGPRLAADLPTPRLGVLERLGIYASLLWTAMLAAVLLSTGKKTCAVDRSAALAVE